MAVLTYLIVTGDNLDNQNWDYVWFTFSNFVLITIPFVGVFSARHIENNSRSIERLGIRTNSKIMKFYLGFWTSISIDCIVVGVIMIILTEEHKLKRGEEADEQKLRMLMSASILVSLRIIMASCLDFLVLTTYYRLSKKLSASAT